MSKEHIVNISILLAVIIPLLFFQYPLMKYYQQSIPESEFSLTTARGDVGFTYDLNMYGNDIISVYQNPGLFLKEPISYEHKGEIIPLQGSIPFLMHALIYAFLKDMTLTLILGSIISTAITIILLYFISDFFQKKYLKKSSMINTFFLVVSFFTLPYVFFELLNMGNKILMRPYIGYVGRFISINHVIIFLLLWFLILIYALQSNRKAWLVALGVSLALLQYSYFYFYSAALLFTATAFFTKFGFKSVHRLFWIYITWFVLSAPYLANMLFSGASKEFMRKAGVAYSNFHSFAIHLAILSLFSAAFFVLNYFYVKRQSKGDIIKTIKESNLVIALLAVGVFFINIQYILGYTIQPSHWIVTFVFPIGILVAFGHIITFLAVVGERKKYALAALSFVTLILMIGAAFHLSTSARQWHKYFYFDSDDQKLMEFIKTTPEDSVFFGDTSYTNDIISVNTERRTLLGHPLQSIMPISEINSRILYGYEKLNFSRGKLYNDIMQSASYFDYLGKLRSLEFEEPYQNFNNIFHYYHLAYATNAVYGPEKLISDLSNTESKTFKLDYAVYGYPITSENAVFANKKYTVVKVS
ncbi:MAG TPA: hypothetical protein VJI46_06900 [Candidatus Nanoarchaeia archaeon]|nr:hypothetical protein [Candidatus Nanoarchaeia archaeon]